MFHSSPHSFHIPVLGVGYSVDTPLKVARYGISSVMSIVDDALLEKYLEGEEPDVPTLRKLIRNCPAPMEVAEGGHFVQEWGEDIARAALKSFGL